MFSKLFSFIFAVVLTVIVFSFIDCSSPAAAQQSPCQKVDSDTGKCLDKALKPSEPYPGPDKTVFLMETPFTDKATAEVLQRPLQQLVHPIFGRSARVVGSRAELPPDQKAPVHHLEVTVGYQFGERDQTDGVWKATGRVVLEPVVRGAERQLPGSLGQAADILFRAGVRSSDLDGRNFTGDHEFVVDVKLDGKGLERRLLYIRVKSSTGLFRNKTCHKITGYGEAIEAVKNGVDGLPKEIGCGYRAFELGILAYAAEKAFETSWVTPWLTQLKKSDAEAADMANCLRRESDGAGGWVCVERTKTFSTNDCRVQVKDPAIPGGWRCVAEEATPPVTVTVPPAPAAPDPKGKDPWEGCAPERRRTEGGTGVRFCAPAPTPRDGMPSHPAPTAPATPRVKVLRCDMVAPLAAKVRFSRTYALGDTGAEVAQLQTAALVPLGILELVPTDTPGRLGDKTSSAIKALQSCGDLEQTGVLDRQTIEKLFGGIKPSPPKRGGAAKKVATATPGRIHLGQTTDRVNERGGGCRDQRTNARVRCSRG